MAALTQHTIPTINSGLSSIKFAVYQTSGVGIGPLVVAGPLVGALVGALENAIVRGGFSALGAAIYSVGIPKDSIVAYESSVQAGKFLVMIHGTNDESTKAKEVLQQTAATTIDHHTA